MPLGMEVGLGPGDLVFDGDPATSRKKVTPSSHPIFGPCLLWPHGWMIKVTLGTELNIGSGDVVLDGVAAPPLKALQFSVHVYCGRMAGWMKTLLGTDVDVGPCHTVLDGVPALRKRGQPPVFSAHVYCGHGRPSQLLLSSCYSNGFVFLSLLLIG